LFFFRSTIGLFPALVLSIIGTLFCSAQTVPPLPTATQSSSTPSVLSGVVLNAVTGSPVYRALVQVNGRAMLTDHEGRFEFDQFTSSGSVSLEVRKPGFYFGGEGGGSSRTLRVEQMGTPIILRMRPEALITGTVTAPDHSPLPRTMVSALRSIYNQSGHHMVPMGQGLTNAHGEFRITVPAGDYRVQTNFSPRLAGSGQAILPVAYPADPDGLLHIPGGTEQRLELHPAVSQSYPVKLKIETGEERGFPSLLAKTSDGSILPVRVTRAAEAGSGEMRVELPPGTFTLIGYSNRGSTMEYGEASITVGDGEEAGLVMQLSPVPPIPLQIVADSEATSDKALPTAQQLGIFLENIQSVRMNPFPSAAAQRQNNQESALHAAPGTYKLVSRSSGQWFVKAASYGTTDLLRNTMTVTWGAASAPIVVTVSDRTGGLQGTTAMKGTTQPAWIYAIPSEAASVPFYEGHSGADGTFRFPYLPPGSYQVIAFEDRAYDNLADSKIVGAYATYIHGATIHVGETATVNLEAVPDAEMRP